MPRYIDVNEKNTEVVAVRMSVDDEMTFEARDVDGCWQTLFMLDDEGALQLFDVDKKDFPSLQIDNKGFIKVKK